MYVYNWKQKRRGGSGGDREPSCDVTQEREQPKMLVVVLNHTMDIHHFDACSAGLARALVLLRPMAWFLL